MNESQWTPAGGPPTAPASGPVDPHAQKKRKSGNKWPLYVIGGGASVTIWGGWVGLGGMTGFGKTKLLPGIWDSATLNLAITLPLGMEAYAAYAFRCWLDRSVPKRARIFAMCSSIASAALGMAGQSIYHTLRAAGRTVAPNWVTAAVACFPVLAALMGAILHQLQDDEGGAGLVACQCPASTSATTAALAVQPPAPRPSAELPAGSMKELSAAEPPVLAPVMDRGPGTGDEGPPMDRTHQMDPVDPPSRMDPGHRMDPGQGTGTPPLPQRDPAPERGPGRTDGPVPQSSEEPKPAEPGPRPKPGPSPRRPRELQAVVTDGDQVIHTVGARRVLLRDVATLLPKAREINDEHQVRTGRDIGAQKLANVMKIHKATAGGLLKVIKAERDGAADSAQAVAQ